jgi:hypothetical protein
MRRDIGARARMKDLAHGVIFAAAGIFKRRFDKKDGPSPHEKCYFLLDMNFLVKDITNIIQNFTRRS